MKSFLVLLASLFVPVLAGSFKNTDDIRHADRLNNCDSQVEYSVIWLDSTSYKHKLRLLLTQGLDLTVEIDYPVEHGDTFEYESIIMDSVDYAHPNDLPRSGINNDN